MRFVIVTGMSGGGKSTAMKMLEDTGYYCVDNLPVPLIITFADLISNQESEIKKAALGLDVRSDQSFDQINRIIAQLKNNGSKFELLFMDADDEVLLKRYKETRRIHPVNGRGSIAKSIQKEREILLDIKNKADYVIDTSRLLTRELKEELNRIFVKDEEYNNLMIHVMSFGFKNGIPLDADLIFDVRFLPNPFYLDELKKKTGNDKDVKDYVLSFEEAQDFLKKLIDMIEFLIPNYVKEGKHRLVIAIGCTGGKHRSVTFANALYEDLCGMEGYGISLSHRDIERN